MAIRQIDTQTGLDANADSSAVRLRRDQSDPNLTIIVDTTVATAGTLDIDIEWSHDGTTFFDATGVDDIPQITTTGQTYLTVPFSGEFYRLEYTVVTGPFTFTVHEVALQEVR